MFLSAITKPTIFFLPSDEGSVAGTPQGEGAEPTGDAAPSPTPLLKSQGDSTPAADNTPPDWLSDRYQVKTDDGSIDLNASVMKQAEAYKELHSSYVKKTDDLKADVAKDFESTYFAEKGVPETPDAYEYPENFNAPSEEVDKSLREWAKENNVGAQAFQQLIDNVWAKTMPDFEAEAQALGKTEDEIRARIDPLNQWVNSNVDEKHYDAISRVMETAAGVEFMESIADALSPSGFAPTNGDAAPQSVPLTRSTIRELQADERYGSDETYTEMVREKWRQFAAMPPEKQR